jgi:hypothetical protein
MQCNGIREHITSNPGFRKLHPGYGPPASSRPLVPFAAWERFVGESNAVSSKEQKTRFTFEMETE